MHMMPQNQRCRLKHLVFQLELRILLKTPALQESRPHSRSDVHSAFSAKKLMTGHCKNTIRTSFH